MPLPLPPPGIPEQYDGQHSLDWLAGHPSARGVDQRWMFAAVGATLALEDSAMGSRLAGRLRHSPGRYVTGIVAWAAAAATDETRIPGQVRDWLLGHQHDICSFLDAIGDPSHPAQPYGPVTVDHAHMLLREALTMTADNDAHSETVAMVRTIDVETNPAHLAPGRSAQESVFGDVIYLGRAAWEADAPLVPAEQPVAPDRGEHHLALYLLGPGSAEAAVTGIPSGRIDAGELVVGHAAAVLAAGGVNRVVGRVDYHSPWRTQPGWDWDRNERQRNHGELRRCVLEGAACWLHHGNDRQTLEYFVADLHEAAGLDRRILAVHGRDLFETITETAAGEALWGPLLEYSPDVLGYFGPRSSDGERRVGDWILTAGKLTIDGVQHLPPVWAPAPTPWMAAPDTGHNQTRRDGPGVGL